MIDVVAASVKKVISLEGEACPDYKEIESISLEMIRIINESKIKVPKEIYEYLDDFDIRRKDLNYRSFQRKKIIRFMDLLK